MIDYTGTTPVTYTYVYDAHGNVAGLADKNGAIPAKTGVAPVLSIWVMPQWSAVGVGLVVLGFPPHEGVCGANEV